MRKADLWEYDAWISAGAEFGGIKSVEVSKNLTEVYDFSELIALRVQTENETIYYISEV